jgi:hypothetical protein
MSGSASQRTTTPDLQAGSPTTQPHDAKPVGEGRAGKAARVAKYLEGRPSVTAALVLAVASIALWAPPVQDLGFYYDDWALLAALEDAPSNSPVDLYNSCRDIEPAGRPGGCVYHTAAYLATGGRARAYHLMSLGLVWISGLLLYLLLVRCRMPRGAALGVAVLWVFFPGSDATRLWPAAVGAQLILSLYFVAVLLAIAAISRRGGRSAVLHALSYLVLIALVFTYEIVVPLIGIAGVFYWLARPGRPALLRGAADLAFALVFVGYRTVISPVDPDTGFVVERSGSELVARVGDIADGAWQTWRNLFLPGGVGAVLAIAGIVAVAAAVVAAPETRRPILRWLAIAGLAAVLVAAALCAYLPANDHYIPQVGGTFNRLNLAAAPAFCLGFVALLGAVFVALTRLFGRQAAIVAVAVACGAVAAHQLEIESRSQEAWAASWQEQTRAAAFMEPGLARAPRRATIVSFGHPIWERGYVPVFAASWDLRGLIDYLTENDPDKAVPFLASVSCLPGGIGIDGQLWAPYRGDSPVWFVHAGNGASRSIASRGACERTAALWGLPPFWGSTVTDTG